MINGRRVLFVKFALVFTALPLHCFSEFQKGKENPRRLRPVSRAVNLHLGKLFLQSKRLAAALMLPLYGLLAAPLPRRLYTLLRGS